MREEYEGKICLNRLLPIDSWKIDNIRFLRDSDIYMSKKYLYFMIIIVIIAFFVANQAYAKEKEMYIKINLLSKELIVIQDKDVIERFPISIGTELSPTPIGIYTVTEKAKSWGGGLDRKSTRLNS